MSFAFSGVSAPGMNVKKGTFLQLFIGDKIRYVHPAKAVNYLKWRMFPDVGVGQLGIRRSGHSSAQMFGIRLLTVEIRIRTGKTR